MSRTSPAWPERSLRTPPDLPDQGILIGYSLEYERRTPPIGFRYAQRPSVGVDSEEYLEPILHTGGGHLMTIAPTGAGKGVSCIIPTLLRFPGPTIVIDPKGENYAVTAERRRELGQEIILLDPMGITGGDASALNPLDLIDPDDSMSIDDAAALSSLLTGGIEKADPQNAFWYQRGEQLTTGLIQHIAVSRPAETRNLTELRRLLNLPAERFVELVSEEMAPSPDPDVRSVAGMLTNPAVEMVGSVMGMAQNSLEFLRGGLIEAATTTSSFDLEAVTRGDPLSIYMVIPPDKLESHRNLLRVWIGALMAALMRRRAPPPHRTLFILDEAAQLGSLDQLRQAITLMRGYGLQTWSFWQDLSQLTNLYPSDWETMYNNCRVHQSFGFTNLRAAERAADLAGFYDPLEVLGLDADEMILSIAGDEAVIARKPNYLSDPAFRSLYAENPFYAAVSAPPPRPRRPPRRYVRPAGGAPRVREEAPQPQAPDPIFEIAEATADPSGSPSARSTGAASDGSPPGAVPESGPARVAKLESIASRISVLMQDHEDDQRLADGVGLEGWAGTEVVRSGETAAVLDAVAPALPGEEWSPYSLVVRRAPLSFYPGCSVFELHDPSRPAFEWVVAGEGHLVRLDWSRAPFEHLNIAVPIELTDESALDYVRLFFRFVRGRHGHFHVVETVDDVPVPWAHTPEGTAALGPYVHPLGLREVLGDGTRLIDARFSFRDSIFSAVARVEPDGDIDLEDETVVVESVQRLAAGDEPADVGQPGGEDE